MALTPGTRLGIYDITAPLGEGGMGQVWRATDTTLGRQVAMKILPDARQIPIDSRASSTKRNRWRHSTIRTSPPFTASKRFVAAGLQTRRREPW